MNAHSTEVTRLAHIVCDKAVERGGHVSIEEAVDVVCDVLDAYRPRIEWEDETPEADPTSDDFQRRFGGVRYITASLRVGAQRFKFAGHLRAERAGHVQNEVESYKRYIRASVGRSFAAWADGESAPRKPREVTDEVLRCP